MARVDHTGPLGGFRGLWAAGVTSSNNAGWYLRSWRTSQDTRSPAQLEARETLGLLAYFWRNLTPSQRAAWSEAAALPDWQKADWFGNPRNPGGIGLYVRLNFFRVLADLAPITDPPEPEFPPAPTINTASLTRITNAAFGSVTMTLPVGPTLAMAVAWLTPGGFPTPAPSGWRKKLDSIRTQSPLNTLSLWQRAKQRYGLPYVGQSWTLFVACADTSGRLSQYSRTTVTVGAP